MKPEERIATLRSRCLDRKHLATGNYRDDTVVVYETLKKTFGMGRWARRGALTAERLARIPLEIDDMELLGGRIGPFEDPGDELYEEARGYIEEHQGMAPGQTGHCQLDFLTIFEKGVDGMIEWIESSRDGSDGEKEDTYESFVLALRGFSRFIERVAKVAEDAMETASPKRREELALIVESCLKVAHVKPESFREAIQLMWLVEVAVMRGDRVGLVVPGHMDRFLWPFYEKDRATGQLTQEEALVLIESVYLLINECVADGGAMSVMVGGRDENGVDVTNELSYLCMEALRRTNLVYPTVGVCWNEDTPVELTDLTVELISKGYATPAFFGDDTIQNGLKMFDTPPEQACDYINSTCVEITPVGSSNVWVASPYFSVCKDLLDEIDDQVANGREAVTFEAFFERYKARLARDIESGVAAQREFRELRRLNGGKPLQSVFTRDCIGRGRDIDNGGALYNWVECSFVGIANLADSLKVIQKEVFEKKNVSLKRLKEILNANFEGFESERKHYLDGYPKYGNNDESVDALVGDIIKFVRKECATYKMPPDDSHFVPGAFCWIMHERLGRECGATPDGRLAGVPFADGCGPAQGREKNGPTSSILSTTSWNQAPLIGGAAYNMKFNKQLFTSVETRRNLRDLIVTFLKRGGFETQINVVDHETLRKAKTNPDEYQDLVVRIGGYTDYFARLSPQMQDEVMLRTEFSEI